MEERFWYSKDSNSFQANLLLSKINQMTKIYTILFFLFFYSIEKPLAQSPAAVKEYKKSYVTYPFSDPDPIPSQAAIYPYFRFDGFTNTPVNKEWTVVELENDYIKVIILPEIGGKIWTAIDKTTGKPYLYDNKVVKFRDVAMRGPWTSGGLEPNYGIIGHTPNCATPVDYVTRVNDNGSVSCFIGVLDLLTRTRWQIEINLPKDKAYFTTNSIWNNPTGIGQPYYHWMNTGIKIKGNLEFVFPGTSYIGHEGEHASWPVNESNGKKLNFYEENDFGTYKSYHVLGRQTDFFGAYWHDDQYGMVKYAPYDEKVGKKIWIWGLSRQGMIWEKMLTDNDGQYAEIQSGRLFNQNAAGSSLTPFKHLGFAPHGTDSWTEYWYPVNRTEGIVVANAAAALNVRWEEGWLKWFCSPVAFFRDELEIRVDGKLVVNKAVDAKPLQTIVDSVRMDKTLGVLSIALKGQQLEWSSDPDFKRLSRPLDAPKPFDWNTAEGLAIQAKELMDQKMFADAELKLKSALVKDPNSMLALVKMAELEVRNGAFKEAFHHARAAISFDAHHSAANYYYGLSASALGKESDAIDGFSVAAIGTEYRSAAYVEIAKLHARKSRWQATLEYATKAILFNNMDVAAISLNILAYSKLDNQSQSDLQLKQLGLVQPLNPFFKWETAIRSISGSSTNPSISLKNELSEETLLELAGFYIDLNLNEEGIRVLNLLPNHPVALYWMAYLHRNNHSTSSSFLSRADTLPTGMIFPFRTEHLPVLQWASEQSSNWKPDYYLALLLHDKNRQEDASNIIRSLGNRPDAAPVYALRALWTTSNPSEKEADLKYAAALDRQSWRYPKLLIQHQIQQLQFAVALEEAKKYKKEHPGKNFIMDMLLAKTLLLNHQYKSCDSLLALMDIIPFEGATDGRVLYWEAKMMQAVQMMKLGKYKSALGFIRQASEWPENLGVGKPYESDIDSRLEHYLTYLCLKQMKQQDQARLYLDKILEFKPGINNTIRNFQPANNLVTKWASDAKGNVMDWPSWMGEQMNRYPQFRDTFKWVLEVTEKKQHAEKADLASDPWKRVLDRVMGWELSHLKQTNLGY